MKVIIYAEIDIEKVKKKAANKYCVPCMISELFNRLEKQGVKVTDWRFNEEQK